MLQTTPETLYTYNQPYFILTKFFFLVCCLVEILDRDGYTFQEQLPLRDEVGQKVFDPNRVGQGVMGHKLQKLVKHLGKPVDHFDTETESYYEISFTHFILHTVKFLLININVSSKL